jgi:hypothetical protein
VADLRERLAGPAPAAGENVRRAVELTTRMVLYATER